MGFCLLTLRSQACIKGQSLNKIIFREIATEKMVECEDCCKTVRAWPVHKSQLPWTLDMVGYKAEAGTDFSLQVHVYFYINFYHERRGYRAFKGRYGTDHLYCLVVYGQIIEPHKREIRVKEVLKYPLSKRTHFIRNGTF